MSSKDITIPFSMLDDVASGATAIRSKDYHYTAIDPDTGMPSAVGLIQILVMRNDTFSLLLPRLTELFGAPTPTEERDPSE